MPPMPSGSGQGGMRGPSNFDKCMLPQALTDRNISIILTTVLGKMGAMMGGCERATCDIQDLY